MAVLLRNIKFSYTIIFDQEIGNTPKYLQRFICRPAHGKNAACNRLIPALKRPFLIVPAPQNAADFSAPAVQQLLNPCFAYAESLINSLDMVVLNLFLENKLLPSGQTGNTL